MVLTTLHFKHSIPVRTHVGVTQPSVLTSMHCRAHHLLRASIMLKACTFLELIFIHMWQCSLADTNLLERLLVLGSCDFDRLNYC